MKVMSQYFSGSLWPKPYFEANIALVVFYIDQTNQITNITPPYCDMLHLSAIDY